MTAARDRLLNGLAKLQETNITVDAMQKELAALQPVLAQKTADTQQLLLQVWPIGEGLVHTLAFCVTFHAAI
jgi:dynein heavy chain